MNIHQLFIAAAFATVLSACATTSSIDLAPNVVQLDTSASGLISVNNVGETVHREAAQATIERGYTHYRVIASNSARGRRLTGVTQNVSGMATATRYGNTTYLSGSGFGTATPIYSPTAEVSIIVEMFNSAVEGSFSAAEVLGE